MHHIDIIMTTVVSQITSLMILYSIVYSGADQRKHQSSASLAFVWGIHWDQWIPRTKGQLRGKCFRLMTSSWVDKQLMHEDNLLHRRLLAYYLKSLPLQLYFFLFILHIWYQKSKFIQVIAWCCQATNHYLNRCWPRLMILYGLTGPQCINHTPSNGSCLSACRKAIIHNVSLHIHGSSLLRYGSRSHNKYQQLTIETMLQL